jgi:hypothetical protein
MKRFLQKKLNLQARTIRKYKDPLNVGDICTYGDNMYLILRQRPGGFSTITPFQPSIFWSVDAIRVKILVQLFRWGFYQSI